MGVRFPPDVPHCGLLVAGTVLPMDDRHYILRRIAAHIIDTMISYAVLLAAGFAVVAAAASSVSVPTEGSWNVDSLDEIMGAVSLVIGFIMLVVILTVAFFWLYEALMTASKLQATLGKAALGLKVVTKEGERLGFGRATGRYFAKAVTWMAQYALFLGSFILLAALSTPVRAVIDNAAFSGVWNLVLGVGCWVGSFYLCFVRWGTIHDRIADTKVVPRR